MDSGALDIIAKTAVEGIQAMGLGEPLLVIVLVSPLQPHLPLRNQLFACSSNLHDDQVRDVLELAIEASDRKHQRTVGSS